MNSFCWICVHDIRGTCTVGQRIHWVSDHPLGLFIRFYFGRLAAHPDLSGLSVMDSGDGKLTVQLLPNLTPVGSGVTLSMKF